LRTLSGVRLRLRVVRFPLPVAPEPAKLCVSPDGHRALKPRALFRMPEWAHPAGGGAGTLLAAAGSIGRGAEFKRKLGYLASISPGKLG
jgi:hypothetical protein